MIFDVVHLNSSKGPLARFSKSITTDMNAHVVDAMRGRFGFALHQTDGNRVLFDAVALNPNPGKWDDVATLVAPKFELWGQKLKLVDNQFDKATANGIDAMFGDGLMIGRPIQVGQVLTAFAEYLRFPGTSKVYRGLVDSLESVVQKSVVNEGFDSPETLKTYYKMFIAAHWERIMHPSSPGEVLSGFAGVLRNERLLNPKISKKWIIGGIAGVGVGAAIAGIAWDGKLDLFGAYGAASLRTCQDRESGKNLTSAQVLEDASEPTAPDGEIVMTPMEKAAVDTCRDEYVAKFGNGRNSEGVFIDMLAGLFSPTNTGNDENRDPIEFDSVVVALRSFDNYLQELQENSVDDVDRERISQLFGQVVAFGNQQRDPAIKAIILSCAANISTALQLPSPGTNTNSKALCQEP
jgi:hypothetical protein